MGELQRVVNRVQEELEQRGATAVSVQADVNVSEFAQQDGPLGGRVSASASADYDGDPEWVRNAVRGMDQVEVRHVQDETYPGGDVHVSADILLLEGGSPGPNPGGRVDSSPSPTAVPPPAENEATQDPHVAPGGTWAIEDENGIADEYEVEVWPVRVWEARPGVQATIVLRYIPHPAAEGLDWWAGYVRLAEQPVGSVDWQSARHQVEYTVQRRHEEALPLTYHDGHGWVGWHGDPEDHGMDNQAAASVTEALAQAALEVRREVLP